MNRIFELVHGTTTFSTCLQKWKESSMLSFGMLHLFFFLLVPMEEISKTMKKVEMGRIVKHHSLSALLAQAQQGMKNSSLSSIQLLPLLLIGFLCKGKQCLEMHNTQ